MTIGLQATIPFHIIPVFRLELLKVLLRRAGRAHGKESSQGPVVREPPADFLRVLGVGVQVTKEQA